jgi:transposase
MKTTSLDLRERIVAAYDEAEGTREQVARRFRVSLGLVKKLLAQRKRTQDLRPRHRFSGRKPKILDIHKKQLKDLLAKRPDLTLEEMRKALGLGCTLPAIHYVLVELKLTYKKRHCAPPSRTAPTSRGGANTGAGGRAASTRRSSSFWTKPRPKRT